MSEPGESETSLLWLKKIEPELLEIISAERQNTRFSFPLESFASLFVQTFRLEEVQIALGVTEWRVQENFLNGLGKAPISFAIQLSPLEGAFFWIMSYEDISRLISWLRDTGGNAFHIDHPDLLKGIYRFVILESLRISKHLRIFEDLSPKILDGQRFDSVGLCIDVSLKKGEETLWGRVVVPKSFMAAFENHFSIKRSSIDAWVNSPSVNIPLSISLGAIELSKHELQSLQEGDFVLLNTPSYKPKEERGNFTLLVGEHPLFQIKYKEGKMKIFDFAYAQLENDYAL
jgi:hypothetical protein